VKGSRAPSSVWLHPPGPVTPGLRIGLLGGSYNPAHSGHLHVSEVALKRLGLDYVWWLVSPQNPLKSSIGMAPLHDRLHEARMLASHPRILVMDIERTLHTHYSVDTIKALQRRFPGTKFVWLMGSDNLESFHRWRHWPEIVRRVPVAVVTRPGSAISALHAMPMLRFRRARCRNFTLASALPPAIAVLDGPRNSQSSTAIRGASQGGEAMAASVGPC
jgi:nicotinate-nucleotide adenylyltransferase